MFNELSKYFSESKHNHPISNYALKDKVIVLEHKGEGLTRMIYSYQMESVIEIFESNRNNTSSLYIFDLGKVNYLNKN